MSLVFVCSSEKKTILINQLVFVSLRYIRWSKKSKKSWAVPQVMDGGGVQVRPPEMLEMHQPSTFSRKMKIIVSIL